MRNILFRTSLILFLAVLISVPTFAQMKIGDSPTSITTGAQLDIEKSGSRTVFMDTGKVGIGDVSPASLLTVGSGDLFQVDSSGNIVKINNVTTSFPSSQGSAGTILTNNGSGTLTWSAPAGISADSLNFTDLSDSLLLDASTDIFSSGTNVLSVTNSGTGLSFRVNDDGTLTDATPVVVDASGNVGIGVAAPASKLDVAGSIRFSTTGSEKLIANNGGTTFLEYDSSGNVFLRAYDGGGTVRDIALQTGSPATTRLFVDETGLVGIGTASPTSNLAVSQTVAATGVLKGIVYTGAVNTNQTLSTEIPSLTLTTAGRQWATGALTTQREVLITQPTYSFVGASTITDAATVGIAGAPIKSTNATITNTHGLLIQAGAVSTATNSYGITVNAQTGATNNYTAAFLGGNVGIGDTSPASLLTVGSGDPFQVTSAGKTIINPALSTAGTYESALSLTPVVSGYNGTYSVKYGVDVNMTGTTGYIGGIRGIRSQLTTSGSLNNDGISIEGIASGSGEGMIGVKGTSSTGSFSRHGVWGEVSGTAPGGGFDFATDRLGAAAGYFASTISSGTATGLVGKAAGATTDYGGMFYAVDAAGTTNTALYAKASGATNNYAGIFEAGNVGIGTTTPAGKVQVVTTSDTTPSTVTAWDARHLTVGATGSTGSGVGISYDQTNNRGYISAATPNSTWRDIIIGAGTANVGIGMTTAPTAKLTVSGGDILLDNGKKVYMASITNGAGYFFDGSSAWGLKAYNSGSNYYTDLEFDSTGGSGSNSRGIRLMDWNGSAVRLFVGDTGNVGVGNTNPGYLLHVGSASVTDGTTVLRLQDANSTCDFNANTGTPNCGSDITLKKNINDLGGSLEKIQNLRLVQYNWKTDAEGAPKQAGFIAQEVEKVLPSLVSEHQWVDGSQKKFLEMGGLVPYLVGATQELSVRTKSNTAEINELKKENADMKAEISDLKTRLESLEQKLK